MTSTDLLIWFLHPLLVVPLLLWVGYRYLAMLQSVGRVRAYLLVFLCTGLVAAQMSGLHSQAYPLSTWTMYSNASVQPVTWRFVGVAEEERMDFPWEKVAPIREVRAFEEHFTHLVRHIGDEPDGGGDTVELSRLLSTLMDQYNRRYPRAPLERIEVLECEVDVRAFGRRDELDCERLLVVEG